MTILAVSVVATVLTAGAAAPAVGAAGAAATGAATTGAAATGAAAAGAAATGAATTGGATGLASFGAATGGVASGPLGWAILGASEDEQSTGVYTFDCWKLVVHDDSLKPSNGRLLRDIVKDPRIKQVRTTSNNSDLPNLILTNIWDEEFRVEYVYLPDGQLSTHAIKI